MMSRTGIFYIFLAFSVQPKAASQGLNCVTDYCKTISCSLKQAVTSSKNISYWLGAQLISEKKETSRCQLQKVHEDHICSITVKSNFGSYQEYSMTLYYLENGTENFMLNASFRPAQNIKPKTPFNLMLQYANGTYHFFWKNGYEDHVYRTALPIIYEFKYYKDGDNTSKYIVQADKEMIQVDEMWLDPSTAYTVEVRSKINRKDYIGTWSDWSNAVKWKTAYRGSESSRISSKISFCIPKKNKALTGLERHEEKILSGLEQQHEANQVPSNHSKITIGMFSVVGLLILLMSVSAARFKMKKISWVPTPATYFQPLYQNYQGNFQCWVLTKSPLQDFHFMEDFSTIDKISEVMTTLQDQVEKTATYPTGQCQTPYVGPTTEIWAPCQMLDTCSETSIPCEDFSFFCEELPGEVGNFIQSLNVACLSGDGLSLEDLTLNLECLEDCEASEAPVIINPVPVCFKQDYCTLTNTPTGPVPTFNRDVEQDENTSSE